MQNELEGPSNLADALQTQTYIDYNLSSFPCGQTMDSLHGEHPVWQPGVGVSYSNISTQCCFRHFRVAKAPMTQLKAPTVLT